jgi:hypothetical protein
MKSDQGESICAKCGGVLKAQVEIQLGVFPVAIVPLLAGNLTRATADALGYVDQGRLDGNLGSQLRHDLLPLTLDTSAERACALTTLTRQAFVSWVPAPGSTASIVM